MKTLKNIGWFTLAFLSFIMVYSFIQSMAQVALGAGAPIYGVLPLYILLAGAYCYFVYKWYKMSPVTIGTTGLNRYLWLPALVWFLVIIAQFFLPEDPSANQQIITELALRQPIFSFFLIVVFAPLTEELIFRGMLACFLFPRQDNVKQTTLFLLVTSIIFALVHFPGTPQQFLVYGLSGFSLVLAYINKGGLAYSMGLHALNNLISFVMIMML